MNGRILQILRKLSSPRGSHLMRSRSFTRRCARRKPEARACDRPCAGTRGASIVIDWLAARHAPLYCNIALHGRIAMTPARVGPLTQDDRFYLEYLQCAVCAQFACLQ